MPEDGDWQILAEEAALEKDPKKLIEIITALNAALDERQGASLTLHRPQAESKAGS